MRILEIAGSGTVGTADAGPVSSVVQHLANGLVRRGCRVTLLDAPAATPRTRLHETVSVQESTAFRRSGIWARLSQTLGPPRGRAAEWTREVESVVARGDIELIHVHDVDHASIFGRAGFAPVVWTAHGLNWTQETRRPVGPRALANRWLDLHAVARATRVVVLNAQSKRALARPNVSVVPNGLNVLAWPLLNRDDARRELGIPLDEFRVTCPGRIAPEKGTHVFAAATRLAGRQIPLVADSIGALNGHFGHSNRATRYAARVRGSAPHVRFRGFIHQDLPEFRLRLAAADAVVVPSLSEPFGLVVLEALACGAWVIGSDVGGIRDVLNGEVGALVPPADDHALARALVERYRRRTDCSHAPIARARAERFDWCGVIDHYRDLFCNVLRQVKE